MSDVTLILQTIGRGEKQAAEELLPLVYNALRELAAARMAKEAAGHTLQPTALVHEAWLRLVGDGDRLWQNRSHFFGAAAEAMRRILIEKARRRAAVKHGGGWERVDMTEIEIELAGTVPDEKLTANALAMDVQRYGTGTLGGAVTVNSRGGLAPGAGTGTLTINGALTLNADSTNVFEVNGSTLAHDAVAAGSTVVYGGVLKIVPAGSLAAGQQFQLFTGAGATNSSNFASVEGAPSSLSFTFTNGLLSVVTAVVGPTLTNVTPNPVIGSSFPVPLTLTGSGFVAPCTVRLTNLTAQSSRSYVVNAADGSSLSLNVLLGTEPSSWNATVLNADSAPSGQVAFTVRAPATRPNITSVTAPGRTSIVLNGANGTPGYAYAVLTTTNVAQPFANWTPIVTNVFGPGGGFSFTNAVDPALPQLFYGIQQ